MAALLLAAGERGQRRILPNARVMIHQPLGGFSGQATDIEIHSREILAMKKKINRLLSAATGKTEQRIGADTERDRFFDAAEAVSYGLADIVVTPAAAVTPAKKKRKNVKP